MTRLGKLIIESLGNKKEDVAILRLNTGYDLWRLKIIRVHIFKQPILRMDKNCLLEYTVVIKKLQKLNNYKGIY